MIILIGSIVIYFITFSLTGTQTCVNNPNVDQRGDVSIGSGRQVIVPNARFNCNGRITNIRVSMNFEAFSGNVPQFQVWHPTSLNSNIYNKTHEIQLPSGNFIFAGRLSTSYYMASLSLDNSNQIKFQSGDVIGYYQPSNPQRSLRSVLTNGYTSYSNTVASPSTLIDISNVNNIENDRQPLIEITFDIQCDVLSAPDNGNASCSSGRVGVGYEGDSCNFTCNTGYELTGSDTRTCQSDGSWNGTEALCARVSCATQINVNFTCLNGTNTGVFEDFCTFSCNEGYQLQGPNNRACLANGSWSEGSPTCVILCPVPLNGLVDCGTGNSCNFSCNPGYMLQGNVTSGTCGNSGSWNVGLPSCVPLSCSDMAGMVEDSIIAPSCELEYQSQCTVSCDEGFTGDNVTYLCNVTNDPTMVDWVPICGVNVMCEIVRCNGLVNGTLECQNGNTDGVFEDTCTFSCIDGYELQGPNNGTCLANQSWSGGDPICVPLRCSDVTMVADNIMTSSSCDMTYQSQCAVSCDEGFTGDDVTYSCNVTSDPTMVDWVPIGGVDVMCERVQCHSLVNGILQCGPNETTTAVFEDICTFSCNAGYDLQGSNDGTCLANRNWSRGNPICELSRCSDVTTVANNIMISSSLCDLTYQSQCTVSCDEGFTGDDVTYLCNVISDHTTVDWVPIGEVDVMCERVQCHGLLNGSLQCTNGTTTGVFEDNCTFSCNAGYELQGPNNGTCLANQSWSGGDPICVPLRCSDVTVVTDNIMTSSSCEMTYQSQCTVSCDEGFTGDDVTYFCNVTSDPTMVDWVPIGGLDVTCERVQCHDPVNGILQCLDGTTTGVFEDNCTFSCNAGYELQGPTNGTCLANQSWSGGDPLCEPLSCSGVIMVANDIMSSSSCNMTYQSKCTVSCDEGFNGDNVTYLCNVTSDSTMVDWLPIGGVDVMCERVQCTSLSSPINGSISCNSTDVFHYEDQCSFSCDPGYELTGSSSRQCLSNRSWSGSDVTCDILHCKNFTDTISVENSVLANDCGNEFGLVCRVECNTGYRAVGNDTFTCVSVNDTVEWKNAVNGGIFQCDIVTCEDLEEPPNGSINCNSDDQPLQYQDNCTFQCNDGYELQGSIIRQCEASGQWSGSRTQCNIRHCPDITRLVPNSRSCDTSYTSTCMVECEDGYIISGGSSRYICDLNGAEVMWMFNGSGVTCSPVPCVNLSDPVNGNVTCPSYTSIFQDTCTYYCNRGYQLEGNRQTRCNASGIWSSEPVTCTILKCDDPEVEIPNSQLVGACNVTYGSSCLLNCSSGFSAIGNGELVCDYVNDEGASVKWSSIEDSFECVTATTVAQDEDESMFTVPVIGGAVGGVLFLAIVIIVIVVIMLYIRKSKKRKGYSVNSKSSTIYRNDRASTFCVSNQLYEASLPPPQPDYEEAEFSTSHQYKYSVVEKALSTMHRNRPISAVPYEEPVSNTQPGLVQNLYEMPNVTLDEMAESIEAEQQIYETPCEGEESVGPIYCAPPPNEEKIYEEFEGKRFRKIHHAELVTLGELGSGEFGIVTHGKWRPSSQKEIEVAIKMLNPRASDKDRLRFIKEAAIMCQFDHVNVIKLYGVVTDAPRMIVLEYMSRGDLRSLLLKLQSLEIHPQLPLVLLKFCREIAAGMAYLSGKHFIHRDLAARNILVAETTTCKIADFGMSCDLIDENYYVTSGGKVPVKWTAPEALHYRKYSLYSDVWSYGCVMYEIWSLGHKPFEALASDETLVKIESGYRLPPPPGCPRTIYRTMIKCWNPDPRSRPQFGQLVNVLAGNSGYLLGWSDEDKQGCSKEAMMLGAPLEAADDLYHELQLTYAHAQ